MKVKHLLPKLGITNNMIESALGNLNLPVDKGYDIKSFNIITGNAIQMINIYPNINWTDGSCRPAYSSICISICLNKKIIV